MPTPGKTIEVKGLRDLARDFRRLAAPDGRLDKALARANKEAVHEIRDAARANYTRIYPYLPPRQRRRRRRRRTVRGITSRARATGASIVLGGKNRPWLYGQEFGSVYRYPQFRRPPVDREPPVHDTAGISRGRFLYPALRSEVPKLVGRYADIVMRHLRGG